MEMDVALLLLSISKIQKEWWEGDVESNVAMSEIRSLLIEWQKASRKEL